jgi:DNA repair ATPase RecN
MVSSAMQVQLAKGGLWLKFELPSTTIKPLISTASDPRIGQLETILSGINAQFPREFLSQRQGEIDKRLGTVQELQAKLKEAIKLAEKSSQDQDIMLKILSDVYEDLELQKQDLQQLISRIKEAQQLVDGFQKHIDSNGLTAQKLPNCETRIDQLMQTVQQELKELDQELGRVHAQHLLNSAKRSFSL